MDEGKRIAGYRRREERFSVYAEALISKFNLAAPVGAFKLDGYLNKLASRLQTTIDIVSVRKQLAYAAVDAARYEVNARDEFPKWQVEASDFLSKLKMLQQCIRDLSRFDPMHLAEVIIPVDENGRGLALQLPFVRLSESMGNHDSKIVGADSVD